MRGGVVLSPLQQKVDFQLQAQSTQDARHDAHTNWNANPLMLLASSVNTPIDTGPICLPCVARPV